MSSRTQATFDLSRIKERQNGKAWKLQCEQCQTWATSLNAVRVEDGRVSWLCSRCTPRS